jgi:hypothetical protein
MRCKVHLVHLMDRVNIGGRQQARKPDDTSLLRLCCQGQVLLDDLSVLSHRFKLKPLRPYIAGEPCAARGSEAHAAKHFWKGRR